MNKNIYIVHQKIVIPTKVGIYKPNLSVEYRGYGSDKIGLFGLRNQYFIFIAICLIFFSYNMNLFSAQPVRLKNADSLVGISLENNSVRNFIGNVMFEQGEITLQCDTAIQFIEANNVELRGNVIISKNKMVITSNWINYLGNSKNAYAKNNIKIQDTSNTLIAKRGEYNFETNIAHFYEDVSIENDSLLIKSDELINNTENDESVAYGDVRVFGKKNKSTIVSDTLHHKPKDFFILAYGNAGLFYIDTLKSDSNKVEMDTLMIFSDTFFANQVKDNEIYQFLNNVEILKGNLYSKCQKAEYTATREKFELTGEPIVWYDSLQLFADTIEVKFPNQKIEYIKLHNNSFSVSNSDTLGIGKIDQISGRDIDIFFKDDSISVLISKEKAQSLYFIIGEDGESGAQKSGADSISIYFENNDVANIVWKNSAYIEFYPENIFPISLNEYYLPKFKTSYDKPRRRDYPAK
jgi:lipopolysaccharide export system protein LptA